MKREKCTKMNLMEELFLKENNKQKGTRKSERNIEERGITLIALIITIIILLILAGVSIKGLTGDDSLITRARKTRFMTDVRSIEEQLTLKNMEKGLGNEPEIMFGTVEGILEQESSYNEKLVVENGELLYDPENVTDEERQWLDEMGIKPRNNYYLIMMEATKEKFKGQKNIGTIEEFAKLVNEGNFSYSKAYVIENIEIQEENWTPIGSTQDKAFNSCLEGNNYKISSLKMNTNDDNVGLFGINNGTIRELIIENGQVKTSNAKIGMLVGTNNGTIENVTIEGGTVNKARLEIDKEGAGGIAGCNNGTITKCKNSAKIGEEDTPDAGTYISIRVGGIAGVNGKEGTIEGCTNRGEISVVGGTIGGMTGDNWGKIKESENSGNVTSTGTLSQNIGGISGWCATNSVVENCKNKGAVNANCDDVGGIVGDGKDGSSITNCSNDGAISGNYHVGGIFGAIRKCYY